MSAHADYLFKPLVPNTKPILVERCRFCEVVREKTIDNLRGMSIESLAEMCAQSPQIQYCDNCNNAAVFDVLAVCGVLGEV